MTWVGRTIPVVRNIVKLPIQLFQSLISSWYLKLVLGIVEDVEECIEIKLIKVGALLMLFLSWINRFLQHCLITCWKYQKIKILLIIMIWSVSVWHFKKLNRWKFQISTSKNWRIYLWYKGVCGTQNRSKRIWTCESIATFHYCRRIFKNSLNLLGKRANYTVFRWQFKVTHLISAQIFSQILYCLNGVSGIFGIQKSPCTSEMRFWNSEQLISLRILSKR